MDDLTSHERDRQRRLEKEQVRKSQISKSAGSRTRKKLLLYGGVILALAIVVFGITQYQKQVKNTPGKFDAFATCISEKGAYMYGTEWCSHCQNQKKMFGNSFRLVNFIDCDRSANACQNAGVTSYPTWIFADNTRESGTQTFNVLSQKTGCPLN